MSMSGLQTKLNVSKSKDFHVRTLSKLYIMRKKPTDSNSYMLAVVRISGNSGGTTSSKSNDESNEVKASDLPNALIISSFPSGHRICGVHQIHDCACFGLAPTLTIAFALHDLFYPLRPILSGFLVDIYGLFWVSSSALETQI